MAKTAKRIVTIYSSAAFGTTTRKGALVTYAPNSGTFVEFIPTGKRKAERANAKDMVMLEGDHPEGPDGLKSGKSAEWATYDPRYEDEYNIFVNELIAKVDPVVVLIDRRTDAAKATTTIREV